MIHGAQAASIYCGITKDQAELQVKAFEEIHKDYRLTTSV